MNQYEAVKLFNDRKVRTAWDEDAEKWYFSVVDVVGVLTDQATYQRARNYWKVLKSRLLKEGYEPVTNCNRLKMTAEDGKQRLTDVADAEQLLRIIQSIPSPKAEPFKRWLAQVGAERLDEISDPELAINRALLTYRRKGYSEAWINQRLKTIEVRKELTDEWDRSGVSEGREFAILTDEIYKGWSGHTAKTYKRLKGLTKENLRDNMTNMELILGMLAEATTTELSRAKNPDGFDESREVAREGGEIVGGTRREIEARTGRPIVTARNAASPQELTVTPEEEEDKP